MSDNRLTANYDISRRDGGIIFNNIDTMCVWNLLQYDNNHVGNEPDGFIKSMYPYLEYLVLMTFTGGRDYNNWYTENENGNPEYDFRKPVEVIRNVLRGGVRPFIVIGQMPYELSTHPLDRGQPGTEWGNRYLPKDWDAYYRYIGAFARTLVGEFGVEEISQWKFRLMTEWDDCLDVQYWWKETAEDYFRLYDYTLSALASEIGEENLFFGPGNVKDIVHLDIILKHCAEGTNCFTGKTGSKCSHISISSYFQQADVESMKGSIREMKRKAAQYPSLCIHEIGFGEGGFSLDMEGKRLHMAQGITEEYGSALARMFDICNTEGECYFANWEYLTDRCNYDINLQQKPFLKPPVANVAECISKMSGCQRIVPDISGGDTNGNLVGSIAGYDEKRRCLYILSYNHNSKMGDHGTETIRIKFRGIQPDLSEPVPIRQWRIDHDHSNFSSQWLKDSKSLKRELIRFDMGTQGNSRYDTPVYLYLDEEGRKFYNSQKVLYEKLSSLCGSSVELIVSADEQMVEMQLVMPHHSVSFIEFQIIIH